MTLRRSDVRALGAMLCSTLFAACMRPATTTTPAPAPVPVPAQPAPMQPAPPVAAKADSVPTPIVPGRSWSFSYSSGAHAYSIVNVATVTLAGDSLAQPETVTTNAHVTYFVGAESAPRAVSGTVDSFTVRSGARVARAEQRLGSPVAFAGSFDANGLTLTAPAPLPPGLGPCDAPAAAALLTLRDLLTPIPPTLGAGASWNDSTTSTLCRAGVPVTVATVHHYTVVGPVAHDNVEAVRVLRTTTLSISGSGTGRAQGVLVEGHGDGQGELLLDPTSGRLLSVISTIAADVTVDLGAGGPVQRLHQEGKQEIVSDRRR